MGKTMNCYVKQTKNIAKNRKKRKETIVTREYKDNGKHTIINKSFNDYSKAMDEVINAFAEIGAYL